MGLKRRIFSRDFKLQVLREIELGKSMAQACREHQVHPNTIRSWRKLYDQYADQAFAGNGRTYTDEAKVAALERMVGQQAMEIAFLKKALQHFESLDRPSPENGRRR